MAARSFRAIAPHECEAAAGPAASEENKNDREVIAIIAETVETPTPLCCTTDP